MNPSRVDSLLARRGSIVLWQHAIPPDTSTVDPFTGAVPLHAFGPKKQMGPLGEMYAPPYQVRGYLQAKQTTTFTEVYGLVDDRTMQLTVGAVRFNDLADGIHSLPLDLQAFYDRGEFIQFQKGQTVARDRFLIEGLRWTVKSSAVPIIDKNKVVAWRMFVAAETL